MTDAASHARRPHQRPGHQAPDPAYRPSHSRPPRSPQTGILDEYTDLPR
jgi:hypothetical protein